MTLFLCATNLVFTEQHWGASRAGLGRTHLLPRCVLLQERRCHPLCPRHLARVCGAGCGRALLRHLEIPLQGSKCWHSPRLVTTAGRRKPQRHLPRVLLSKAPTHRLPQLPNEAAATAVMFTLKYWPQVVYCFLMRRTDFTVSPRQTKSTLKAVLYVFSLKEKQTWQWGRKFLHLVSTSAHSWVFKKFDSSLLYHLKKKSHSMFGDVWVWKPGDSSTSAGELNIGVTRL